MKPIEKMTAYETFRHELKHVFWNDSDGYRVGLNAKRIWLARDGAGSEGWYDRVHVIAADGSHTVYPAHQVGGWTMDGKAKSSLPGTS